MSASCIPSGDWAPSFPLPPKKETCSPNDCVRIFKLLRNRISIHRDDFVSFHKGRDEYEGGAIGEPLSRAHSEGVIFEPFLLNKERKKERKKER